LPAFLSVLVLNITTFSDKDIKRRLDWCGI